MPTTKRSRSSWPRRTRSCICEPAAACRPLELGIADEAGQERVPAYEAPRNTHAKSEEFAPCELAATHATVNRVTAMPATYAPPPSARDQATAERWAAQYEKPGGVAEVSRDINAVEQSFSNDRSEVQALDRAERQQQRQSERQVEQQAGLEQKPAQPGGDPTVAAPAARPAAGAGEAGPAQEQKQEQEQGQEQEPAR